MDSALADKSLDAMSAVRNVLVHKGGIADQVYVDDRVAAPAAPALEIGEEIQLDGKVVRDLIVPFLSSCTRLISAVDAWLSLVENDNGK